MRRRFNQFSGPVQIGQGVEPFSINTTGVYIYDIYGYCHDVASWPNGYGDEAAGVMVYSSGNPSSSDPFDRLPCRFVIKANDSYMSGGSLRNPNQSPILNVYNFTERNAMGSMWGANSSGLIASLFLDMRGSLHGTYNNIQLERDNVKYAFKGYNPNVYEAMAIRNLIEDINQALSKMNFTTLSLSGQRILLSEMMYTANKYVTFIFDSGSTTFQDSGELNGIRLIIYPVGLINSMYAPIGLYKDIGLRDTLASVNYMRYGPFDDAYPERILRWHNGNVNNSIFITTSSFPEYRWSSSYATTNSPLTNYTEETAINDKDGLSNTTTYLQAYPKESGGIFKALESYSLSIPWCQTKPYIPAFGELYDLLEDNTVLLAFTEGMQEGYYAPEYNAWTSTEVNKNRAIKCYYDNSSRHSAMSVLKTEEYGLLVFYKPS